MSEAIVTATNYSSLTGMLFSPRNM